MGSIEMIDVFQTLFAVAWADGELHEQERAFLNDLVQRSEAGSSAIGWFQEAPPEPNWEKLRGDTEAAAAVLRHAMYMAAADETVQFEETLLMDRLREQLELSQADFQKVQHQVEQERS